MSTPEMLVTIRGPLRADALVDAHLQALRAGARLVVEHDGAPTDVARRTAERFGIELRSLVVAHDEPAPELAHADDAMPWGGAPLEESEPDAAYVEPIELLAFPWFANAEASEDEAVVTSAPRARRGFAEHPTLAPARGLPWPHPSGEAIALNDPRIWHAKERIHAVRTGLDKTGAPSFGAIRPPE